MRSPSQQKEEARIQARLCIKWDSLAILQQKRVKILENACLKILHSPNRDKETPGIAEEATQQLAYLRSAESAPVSAKTMQRLFYRWQNHEHRWQVLLDGRRVCKLYSPQHTNNAMTTPKSNRVKTTSATGLPQNDDDCPSTFKGIFLPEPTEEGLPTSYPPSAFSNEFTLLKKTPKKEQPKHAEQ